MIAESLLILASLGPADIERYRPDPARIETVESRRPYLHCPELIDRSVYYLINRKHGRRLYNAFFFRNGDLPFAVEDIQEGYIAVVTTTEGNRRTEKKIESSGEESEICD